MSVKFTQDRENTKVIGIIKDLPKLTKQGIRQGMFRVGKGLRSEANRAILAKDKTGITYIRKDRAGRRRRHRSSAPGETHANMTGELRRSLSFQLRGTSEIEFGYGVSSGKTAPDYATFLEFGTTRMKARPSLRNAIDSEEGNITQHLGGGIMEILK